MLDWVHVSSIAVGTEQNYLVTLRNLNTVISLRRGGETLQDGEMGFMYQAPPGIKEAKALEKLIKKSKRLYGLTHNYTGYPLVKEARHMVATGKLCCSLETSKLKSGRVCLASQHTAPARDRSCAR